MTALNPYKPSATLDAMTGHRMPGGCDDCDAYQTVTEEAQGVYVLAVHHDASCPAYRAIVAERIARTQGTIREPER